MKTVEYKKKQIKTMEQTKKEEMIKKMKKDADKLVKGQFEFTDAQGGWFDFAYRFFKEDLLMTYHLVHGEITELPLGVVRHLNNTMRKIRTLGETQGGKVGDKVNYGPMERYSRVKFIRMDDIENPQYV